MVLNSTKLGSDPADLRSARLIKGHRPGTMSFPDLAPCHLDIASPITYRIFSLGFYTAASPSDVV